MKHTHLNLFLILLICIWVPTAAQACTLWAAAGTEANQGTMLAKNRDWKPDHQQRIEISQPAEGYRYLALIAEDAEAPGMKAGVNEAGLSIVSASSNIPKRLRMHQPGKHGVMRDILQHYASLNELKPEAEQLFKSARAGFFLLADHRQLMQVEVGLNGQVDIKTLSQGHLAHTNHYLNEALASQFNQHISQSSRVRYHRVNALLDSIKPPYTAQDFIRISQDQHDGADNSLLRTGKEHTLASWLLISPAEGNPELRIVLRNPQQAEQMYHWTLDAHFWEQAKFNH